ncbi:MAG: 16S rRNA (uracil(1498)-N(3))-methyltransferase [Bacteroidales bacterium]|nr:16S rRNA (uracil(1498)-N(3))-methyltransferase [Bacteroidales bacterium]
MHLFYTPDIENIKLLPEEESNHAVKVLRLAEGAEITLLDGKGTFYQAVITLAHPKRCAVEILNTYPEDRSHRPFIQIAVAPTKNIDRIEWLAEKATEIGFDKLTFLKCRYSERKEIKRERINKILISAMKQSLKATLPELTDMTDFKKFVEAPFEGQKFIAHCYKETERVLLSKSYKPGSNVTILIGPEGDFSEQEVELALKNGYVPVSLGKSRLRTETAALVACHTINVINEINE